MKPFPHLPIKYGSPAAWLGPLGRADEAHLILRPMHVLKLIAAPPAPVALHRRLHHSGHLMLHGRPVGVQLPQGAAVVLPAGKAMGDLLLSCPQGAAAVLPAGIARG